MEEGCFEQGPFLHAAEPTAKTFSDCETPFWPSSAASHTSWIHHAIDEGISHPALTFPS